MPSVPAPGGTTAPVHRPRRRRWARVTIIVVVVLAAAAGAAFAGGRLLLDRYTRAITQAPLLGSGAASAHRDLVGVAGPINILLVGVDARGGAGEMVRSDTIILLHVPASHDRAYLISLPRDADVPIPAFPPSGYAGGSGKVNAAFAYGSMNGQGWTGGFQLLAATIRDLTGIGFDAGAIVDFDGFRNVVNALGGVTMCVDEKVTSIHIGVDAAGHAAAPFTITPSGDLIPVPGVRPVVYQPGCQRMAGWQALDYVRQRELLPDGDYGRARHQQQFLRALFEEATASGVLANPFKVDAVLRAAGRALTVDLNGVPVENWLFTVRHISGGDIVSVKVNAGRFNPVWVGNEQREKLTPDTLRLFQAVKDDQVEAFLADHPDWVNAAGATAGQSASPTAGSGARPG